MARQTEGYRSGTAAARAEEFNSLIRDPEIKAVICSIGGWNSASILPFIDYQAFREQPKVVVGYSDFTAILLGLHCRARTVTFHGPAVIPSFGEFPAPFSETVESFLSAVMYGTPKLLPPAAWTDEYLDWTDLKLQAVPRRRSPNDGWRSLKTGIAEGMLIGGNLDTLCTLLGTEYCPDFQRAILFLEESEGSLGRFERNLNQLRMHSVFDRVSGLILGRHERPQIGVGRHDNLLREFLPARDFPVLVDADIGHTAPILTLPIGVRAVLDTGNMRIDVLEGCTTER